MHDSYWMHMVPRQLSKPRKKLVLSKKRAIKKTQKFGDTSKRR